MRHPASPCDHKASTGGVSDEHARGSPLDVFDEFRAALLADRAQVFRDIPTGPFDGFNRPGATVSQGTIDNWRRQRMMDLPTLMPHGDDDQIVPIAARAMLEKPAPEAATPLAWSHRSSAIMGPAGPVAPVAHLRP